MADNDAASREFDPAGLLETLYRHGVRYVVIGGIAAGVQGAVWATTDLDICYAQTPDDLQRLAAALAGLEARPIGLDPGLLVELDARALLRGDIWTLDTRLGRLDIMREAVIGMDYAYLVARARTIRGERSDYLVASLDDLVAMKRAAARPKDVAHIELLQIARDELRRRAGSD
ncbi:MAG: hypothetical protein H0V36_07365 [Chloroflexi bacterium]|nr:hypothetical protein [Chloroflexota bacterium]